MFITPALMKFPKMWALTALYHRLWWHEFILWQTIKHYIWVCSCVVSGEIHRLWWHVFILWWTIQHYYWVCLSDISDESCAFCLLCCCNSCNNIFIVGYSIQQLPLQLSQQIMLCPSQQMLSFGTTNKPKPKYNSTIFAICFTKYRLVL